MSPSQGTDTPTISLDPTKWVEPKETFIARLAVCQYSDTDQSKTSPANGEVTFTEYLGLPRPKRQWRVVWERLDAVFVNKDTGERTPVKRYMTIDLERYDEKTRTWSAVPKGNNKAFFTINKWSEKKVLLHPKPEANEGMVMEVEFLRSKMFGGNTAKDIGYPVRVLALPGQAFEYRGEVEEIEFDPSKHADSGAGAGVSLDDAAAAQGGSAGTSGGGKSSTWSEDEVKAALEEAGVDGTDEEAVGAFVKANKAKLQAAVKVSLIGGDYFSG